MTESTTDQSLIVRDLGRMRYAEALDVQRQVNQAVIDSESPNTLILVEHEPVITVTPRKGIEEHLLASPDRLKALGIGVAVTDRGGDITYHGPGQLVAYPVLRLAPLGLNLGRYMRLLEQVVIDTVATFGVAARRVEGCTGVWVEAGELGEANVGHACDQSAGLRRAKLCAFGVRVRRNVTMHGLALNVTTDLSHFDTIVPCGLANRAVTSMEQLLGDAAPTFKAVKRELIGRFERAVSGHSTLTK